MLRAILLILIFLSGISPSVSIYKFNPSDRSHTVDGTLFVESLAARNIQATEIKADRFIGNGAPSGLGPGLSNLNPSAGGWSKSANLIQLDNIGDEVLIGLNSTTANKLSIAGDLNIKGGALKVQETSGTDLHSIGPGAANPIAGSLSFPSSSSQVSLSLRSRKGLSFVKKTGLGDFIWTKGSNPLAPSVELMRLTADGKLGVSVSNPTERLHANGSVKANKFFGSGSGLTGLIADGQHPSFQCQTVASCGLGFQCVQGSLAGVPRLCSESVDLRVCCKVVLI